MITDTLRSIAEYRSTRRHMLSIMKFFRLFRLPLIGGLVAYNPLYAIAPDITLELVVNIIGYLNLFAAVFVLSLYLIPLKKPR